MVDSSYVQVNTLITVNIYVSFVYAIAHEMVFLLSQSRLLKVVVLSFYRLLDISSLL
jgi:hypothetical protein